MWAFAITWRPSIRRKLSHLNLLLWNHRRAFNTKNSPIHYTTQGIQLNLRKICRSRIFSFIFLLKWRFPYTKLDYFIWRSVKQDHSVTFVPSCASPLVLAFLFMPYWLHSKKNHNSKSRTTSGLSIAIWLANSNLGSFRHYQVKARETRSAFWRTLQNSINDWKIITREKMTTFWWVVNKTVSYKLI